MLRFAYQCLLSMHPEGFRSRYGDEMLWIYEEASAKESVLPLFTDAIVSLTRQWVLRSGTWKVPVALAGALVQVMVGGLGQMAAAHQYIVAEVADQQFRGGWSGMVEVQGRRHPMILRLSHQEGVWRGEAVIENQRYTPDHLEVAMGSVILMVETPDGRIQMEGRRVPGIGQVQGVVSKLANNGTRSSAGRWRVDRVY